MARRQLKAIPILPDGRDSKTPSYAQILDTFAARAKYELYEDNQLIKVFTQPFSELEPTALDLLDIDAAAYR